MPAKRVRRFRILDAMTLVAATAGGAAGLRSNLEFFQGMPDAWRFGLACSFAKDALITALPMPVAWTLAVAVIRMRRPRPPWRRLMRQPGLVAALAAASALALVISGALLRWLAERHLGIAVFVTDGVEFERAWRDFPDRRLRDLGEVLGPAIGLGVAVAWIILAASGRWRAEPGWIDRAGRVMGVFWLLTLPLLGLSVLAWFGV